MTATITPDDLVTVDDMPDLDAVLPCEVVEVETGQPDLKCEEPATWLVHLVCAMRHPEHDTHVLMCEHHCAAFGNWMSVFMATGMFVVNRVPL